MRSYFKTIQKIVAKTKNKNVSWRYHHTKNFNQALDLFADFLVDRLQELGTFKIEVAAGIPDITPELQDGLLVQIKCFFLEAKHTMKTIVQEFSNLLDAYSIVIPINEDAYLALQTVLKKREKDIFKELTAIQNKVVDLETRASHTGLIKHPDYKKGIPLLMTLKKFNLQDLDAMFKSHTIPHVFSLLDNEMVMT